MPKKLTEDIFITKSSSLHNGKYDYSKVKYVGSKTNVCIICHEKDENGVEHGEFWQTPNSHLRGRGCPTCKNVKTGNRCRKTIGDFVKEANNIHNNKYDYSQFVYINNKKKGTIICPEHGPFEQAPYEHLSSYGCPVCGRIQADIHRRKTTDEFITEATKIHSGKYTYENSVYDGCEKEIVITCPTHGNFKQIPSSHLSGRGCPLCGLGKGKKRNTKDEFVELANNLHNKKYDYSLVEYTGNKDKVCIICHEKDHKGREHGEFWQRPNDHLSGAGCPRCPRHISKQECEVREVDNKTANIFFEKNHLQGKSTNLRYNIGLFLNNELVSVMSFGCPRMHKNKKAIELLRFASVLHTTVVGGAEKLLKYFVETHKPKEIITYADLRWGNGELYEKLGFTLDHQSKPNYFYVIKGKRENRFKYRKSELVKQGFDPSKSEHEIMIERGIYRIYDCGNKVFKKII
jgi:hypothetical protein